MLQFLMNPFFNSRIKNTWPYNCDIKLSLILNQDVVIFHIFVRCGIFKYIEAIPPYSLILIHKFELSYSKKIYMSSIEFCMSFQIVFTLSSHKTKLLQCIWSLYLRIKHA